MTNEAQEYAHTIAEEIRELEDGRTEDGPTVTAYDAVLDWAERAVLDLEWAESSNARTITEVTILRRPTVTAYDAVLDWAERAVLDLEWTESLNARTITAVTILRTFGGPNAWIDAHGDGTVTVRAAWWGERGEVSTDAPTLDAWAWEAAEIGRAIREGCAPRW